MRVKFYSEYDLGCSVAIGDIIEKINNNDIDNEWNIEDLLEFYNILKYINIQRFKEYIMEKTNIEIKEYEKKIKQKLGRFIGKHKGIFIDLYKEIDFEYANDFFEIFEKHKLYESVEASRFKDFLIEENVSIGKVLENKCLTEYFNDTVKDVLLSNSINVEIILSKYLEKKSIYLPPALQPSDILKLIKEYLSSSAVNLNTLRSIINFPQSRELKISDKLRLQAKRRNEKEEEEIFSNAVYSESSIIISYPKNQYEAVLSFRNGENVEMMVSRDWIEGNLDYPTLWNNFIYLFNFVDETMRLQLDSKQSEIGTLERVFRPQAEYLYPQSEAFSFKEIYSAASIQSYTVTLGIFGVKLEQMIKWFFVEYLDEEFQIENFISKMTTSDVSYFEKCRLISPEMDRIFKQYNILIEDGEIDQELVQISSSSLRVRDIKSFNTKKYVYAHSDWYNKCSFLLFSDQSRICYVPDRDKQAKNFFELIMYDGVTKSNFHEYQLQEVEWLFEERIICEDVKGYIRFKNPVLIKVLKEFYYEEVISYWHCPTEIKLVIEDLSNRNFVEFESSLFSRNEQNYFDYYLNKSKYSNGHDIRNKYVHGSNTNDDKQNEHDYYLLLKLFVILVIKINDDLCIRKNNSTS